MTLSLAELGLQLLSVYTDGICVYDQNLQVLYWNPGMEQIFGLREDAVRGQPLLDWVPFAPMETPALHPGRVLGGDSFVVPNLPFAIKESGKSGFVECTYRPLRDAHGAIQAGIALVRDVTGRRQAEAELREVESRFQRMADSSPVLLWMAGLDGECNFFNQTWLRFTGRTLAQEYGVGWAEGIHPLDFQHCMDIYVDHFNARTPFEMEYRLQRADGEYRWILDRGAPRYNQDGSFAGFIGSCTDISDRKNAELALQEALVKAMEPVAQMGEVLHPCTKGAGIAPARSFSYPRSVRLPPFFVLASIPEACFFVCLILGKRVAALPPRIGQHGFPDTDLPNQAGRIA